MTNPSQKVSGSITLVLVIVIGTLGQRDCSRHFNIARSLVDLVWNEQSKHEQIVEEFSIHDGHDCQLDSSCAAIQQSRIFSLFSLVSRQITTVV